MVQQAAHRSFDAMVILGHGYGLFPGFMQEADPAAVMAEVEAAYAATPARGSPQMAITNTNGPRSAACSTDSMFHRRSWRQTTRRRPWFRAPRCTRRWPVR